MGVEWATLAETSTIVIAVRDTFSVIVVVFFASKQLWSQRVIFGWHVPVFLLPPLHMCRHLFRMIFDLVWWDRLIGEQHLCPYPSGFLRVSC
jgi:hypothetical protein